MKSHVTFRRHPSDELVARTNEDRHPLKVVAYGRFGAGLWRGHRIGLVMVLGMMLSVWLVYPNGDDSSEPRFSWAAQ
jgi:hypothetical protein